MDVAVENRSVIGQVSPTGNGPMKPIVGGAVNRRVDTLETEMVISVAVPSLKLWRVSGRSYEDQIRRRIERCPLKSLKASLNAEVTESGLLEIAPC